MHADAPITRDYFYSSQNSDKMVIKESNKAIASNASMREQIVGGFLMQ